jgi:hypothetical protein
MGRVWKGRMCWATTRVARRVEGRGFSMEGVSGLEFECCV